MYLRMSIRMCAKYVRMCCGMYVCTYVCYVLSYVCMLCAVVCICICVLCAVVCMYICVLCAVGWCGDLMSPTLSPVAVHSASIRLDLVRPTTKSCSFNLL